MTKRLDCLVIGYNESPFESYEALLRNYGEDSEAYRDLKFSFVDLGGRKLNYVGLMNHAWRLAGRTAPEEEAFISGDIPTLAAAYLTNFLRRRGYSADYVNLFQYEKDETRRAVEEERPRLVVITTTLYVVNPPATEIVEFVRSVDPSVPIVVGGPLIANHNRNYEGASLQAALDDIGADYYIVEGQGEATLARLVECLRVGGDVSAVPNLLYVEDGQLHRTAVEPERNDLDETYIDWRGFGRDLGPTIQTRTARSCAFKCSFCNYPTRAGKLALASIDTIARELDSMAALSGVKNVVFIDDTFNVPLPRFKDICRLMIDRGYGFNWFSYFRCSNSDEEAIELMAESGCKGVFLGIESGSPRILTNMNKHATIEKYAQGIEWLRKAGVLTFGSFIVGFPGETAETIEETIDFLRRHRPDYYRTQLWYCEPGTPIYLQKEKYGIEGDGFVWTHDTMESLEAMDHIDRIFLTVQESQWLPQWSFDFWIIPYLLGRDVELPVFREFMHHANRALALELAAVAPQEKARRQKECLDGMVAAARRTRRAA
jgi:radical SAM PhpK family P-methyltransferase